MEMESAAIDYGQRFLKSAMLAQQDTIRPEQIAEYTFRIRGLYIVPMNRGGTEGEGI